MITLWRCFIDAYYSRICVSFLLLNKSIVRQFYTMWRSLVFYKHWGLWYIKKGGPCGELWPNPGILFLWPSARWPLHARLNSSGKRVYSLLGGGCTRHGDSLSWHGLSFITTGTNFLLSFYLDFFSLGGHINLNPIYYNFFCRRFLDSLHSVIAQCIFVNIPICFR